MKKIKIGIMTAAAALLFVSPAFAEPIPYNVDYDYLNNSLTVSGENCIDGDFITIQIIKNGKNFDNFEYTDLLYGNQYTVSDKKYKFVIDYDVPSGVYNARIASSGNYEATDVKMIISSADELEKIYAALNSAAKADNTEEFRQIVNDNIAALTAEAESSDTLTNDDYFKYVKENELKIENIDANTKVLNTFLIAEQLNEGKLTNVIPKIEKLYFKNENIKTDCKNTLGEQQKQIYFTSKISNRKISNLDEFNAMFQEGIILTSARYGTGYGELQGMVTKYGSAVGINSPTSDANVYKKLMGRDYVDKNAFKNAYTAAISEGNKQNTGGGGTSSSGSRGSTTTASTVVSTPMPTVKIVFEDIDGVDWASEAIIALADKGIINGKEPNKFKPNAEITREEFVKILVGAMGYSENNYTSNVFSDVKISDWFCGWVNTAYEKGIISGMDDGSFGAGMNISRQDMCVMLCNALKIKGVQLTEGQIPFDDEKEIADYAKTSVGSLFDMNVINGIDDTHFAPNGNATRAQAAKIVYEVLDRLI